MTPARKKRVTLPVRQPLRPPDWGELFKQFGLNVTICIAGMTADGCIVTVSDRRLSYGYYEATDDGLLKAQGLNENWGVLFAFDDPNPLGPMILEIRRLVRGLQNAHAVTAAVEDTYLRHWEESAVAANLTRLGIHSLDEFRENGLKELGETIFRERLDAIEKHDLRLSMLIYGFDMEESGNPRLFQITNPGGVDDLNIVGFGVIGSGFYPAYADLTARGADGLANVNEAIYRLCAAKFRAETTEGVGKATTLMVFRPGGKMKQFLPAEVDKLREIWLAERAKTIPTEADDLITKRLKIGKFMQGQDADT